MYHFVTFKLLFPEPHITEQLLKGGRVVDIQIELITFSTQKILYVPNRSIKFREKVLGDKEEKNKAGALLMEEHSLCHELTPGTSLSDCVLSGLAWWWHGPAISAHRGRQDFKLQASPGYRASGTSMKRDINRDSLA